MATWVSSDWHCQPDGLKDEVVKWIRLGRQGNHRLVGSGDLFDILPLGKKKWKRAPVFEQLKDELGECEFCYVAGNHDPHRTMQELVSPYLKNKVMKNLTLQEGDREYLITHGHRWSIDWGFLGLRHVAPSLVEFMVDYYPRLWNWICRRAGWLASQSCPDASESREKERITNLTRIIWGGASQHALKRDCCVVLGHTHTTGRRERGIGKHLGSQAYMIDAGNLPDGSYVEIDRDAKIEWL